VAVFQGGQKVRATLIVILLVAITGCSRQDGVFQCKFNKNPPINYRYDKSKRQITVISQGSYVINERYAAEEVDGEVLWKASKWGSTSLDRKHMVLLDHFEGSPTASANCAWK